MSIPTETTISKRAQVAIAHGALTNSKRPASFIEGIYPTHLKRGHAAHVWDTAGNKYIDFIGANGSCILGYCQEEVLSAAIDGLKGGSLLSLGSETEVKAAEKVKEVIPFIDQVRFLKTGSEACTAALRIARAHTGRLGVLSHGYHGWHDEFTSLTPPALGVPRVHEYTGPLDTPTPDLDGVAAVIIEPVLTDMSDRRAEWLRTLQRHCRANGTMLIFDEVITGFRVPKFTVANYFGIEPDLIVMGKAMANGMSVSAVGGKREAMSGHEYFVSSTFAGEMGPLSAAIKTIDLLQGSRYQLAQLWHFGELFQNRFNEMWPGVIKLSGYPTRAVFEGDKEVKDLFWQEACKAGILFGASFFFHFGHLGLEDQVIATCRDIVLRLKTKSVKLEGMPSRSPFASKAREQKQ